MQQTLQLDRLPEAARNELFDFYEFLVSKYAASAATASKSAAKGRKVAMLPADNAQALRALAGIWKDRDITLEELRKSAWQRRP